MFEIPTQSLIPKKTGQPSYEYQNPIFRSSNRNTSFTKVVPYHLLYNISKNHDNLIYVLTYIPVRIADSFSYIKEEEEEEVEVVG